MISLDIITQDPSLLIQIGLILIAATVMALVARLLRQPIIPAYIIVGLILGPIGLGLIRDQETIRAISELGIAFLLFVVGLEINLKSGEIDGYFDLHYVDDEYDILSHDWEGRIDGSLNLETNEITATGSGTRVWGDGEREDDTFELEGKFQKTEAMGKAYFIDGIVWDWSASVEDDLS